MVGGRGLERHVARSVAPVAPMTPAPAERAVSGLELRDLFAAFALAGLRAASYHQHSHRTLAILAYEDADAMLKARTGGALGGGA
jgi:hypothetical protein